MTNDILKTALNFNQRVFSELFVDSDSVKFATHGSSFNYHLFLKNIVANPFCAGGRIAKTYHFFPECHKSAADDFENIVTKTWKISIKDSLIGIPFVRYPLLSGFSGCLSVCLFVKRRSTAQTDGPIPMKLGEQTPYGLSVCAFEFRC